MARPTPLGSFDPEPDFVSSQVSEARRYYLNLRPSPAAALTVICGGVERTHPDYLIQRDGFAYYGMEMVTEGRGELTIDGHVHSLSPGLVFAYGPTTPHRIVNSPRQRMRKFYVDLAGHEAQALLRAAGLLEHSPVRVTRMNELVELFELLDREARSDLDGAEAVCGQLVRLMLAKVRQNGLNESPAMPRAYSTYERVRRHIETNYLVLHTIEQVAAACDLTPVHLSRLFRRFAGVNAYHFLLRRKMNHAAELLVEEGMLVKDVAEQLQFSDAFQFSRAFKRVYGISPKQLVRARSSATMDGTLDGVS
ncbi:MAG: AraC family transcriptional regulator [Planctomycetota bacterium]